MGKQLALTGENIDFENGTVSICKSYFSRNRTDYIITPKTESSNRNITIPQFLKEKMKQKTKLAKFKPIREHDLCQSHIALLIRKWIQTLVIAQRVGYDFVNTTMNIYGHLYPHKQKQVADLLNAEAIGELENNLVDMATEMRYRKAGGWS